MFLHRAIMRSLPLMFVVLAAASCADTMTPAPAPSPVVSPPTTLPPPMPPPAPEMARYTVRFESTWSAATHPEDFPDDAHYSPLVGGTHGPAVMFWREGEIASEGIQLMAERGRTSPLDDEIMRAIDAGQAQFVLLGGALSDSPGIETMTFDISRSFPLVTLVTMVAPSPDWFTGVSGLPLFIGNEWLDEVVVDVYAFDAGTDSGATYLAPDEVTSPQAIVTRITGYPITSSGPPPPLGRMVFTRQ